jgi:hypothetical protein
MKYDINNPRPTPSQERLNELLEYSPDTGVVKWKHHPNRTDLIGTVVSRKNGRHGYLVCSVDGNKYGLHRIIYKMMTGKEPEIIDHANGIRDDNRWHNLRSVSNQENNFNTGLMKNNQTGEAGVFYHEKQDRYHANVRIGGKSHHLGSFKTIEEAKAARQAANKILGFSDRHGKAS